MSTTVALASEHATAFLQEEIVRWDRVVRNARIKAE